eukprot:3791270-Alexandrium_andersonii.AAC.1
MVSFVSRSILRIVTTYIAAVREGVVVGRHGLPHALAPGTLQSAAPNGSKAMRGGGDAQEQGFVGRERGV